MFLFANKYYLCLRLKLKDNTRDQQIFVQLRAGVDWVQLHSGQKSYYVYVYEPHFNAK